MLIPCPLSPAFPTALPAKSRDLLDASVCRSGGGGLGSQWGEGRGIGELVAGRQSAAIALTSGGNEKTLN